MDKRAELTSFPIGAVSRMLGVPVETLRSWERRYGVPRPVRNGQGRRQYSAAEVQRLRAIAVLARRGDRVRDLADLSEGELAERLQVLEELQEPLPAPAGPAPLRVVVAHPSWGASLDGPSPTGRAQIQVVLAVPDPGRLPHGLEDVDALVLDGRGLDRDPLALVAEARERVRPAVVLLVARFLRDPARRALEAQGVRLLDEAARFSGLRQQVEDAVLSTRALAGPAERPAPAPRLSRAQVEGVLGQGTQVACGCPQHLADMVLRLWEFEAYSRQCASLGGADATLHAELAEGSAGARAQVEGLLLRVCQADGLAL